MKLEEGRLGSVSSSPLRWSLTLPNENGEAVDAIQERITSPLSPEKTARRTEHIHRQKSSHRVCRECGSDPCLQAAWRHRGMHHETCGEASDQRMRRELAVADCDVRTWQ